MIVTLCSLLGISYHHCHFINSPDFYLVPYLEHILYVASLAYFAVFICMCMVGWLFPQPRRRCFFWGEGGHAMHATVYSSPIIRTICPSGALYVVCVSLCCNGLTTVSSLLSEAGLGPLDCQALSCVEVGARSQGWLATEPYHVSELMLAHWWLEPGSVVKLWDQGSWI